MLNYEHARGYGVFDSMNNRVLIRRHKHNKGLLGRILFCGILQNGARILTVAAILLIASLETAQSNQNPAISNPIGPATVPQSSIRSGLVRSPNPVDTSGNLTITGNVGGGRHFRGVVPYNAISDFGGSLGSSSLDSFLRSSASAGQFNNYTGISTPFYSQTGTVTTTRPGVPSVLTPQTTKISGRTSEGFAQPVTTQKTSLSGLETGISNIGLAPMRFSPQQLEKMISEGVTTYAEAKRIVDEQNPAQMQRLQRDLDQLRHRGPQLRQSLIVRDDPLRPFTKLDWSKDVLESGLDYVEGQKTTTETSPSTGEDVWGRLQPFGLQVPTEQTGEATISTAETTAFRSDKGSPGTQAALQRQGQLDVYEQMKQNIDKFREGLRQPSVAKDTEEATEGTKQTDEATSMLRTRDSSVRARDSLQETEETSLESSATSDRQRASLRSALKDIQDTTGLSDIEISARAKEILGEHRTFASFSEDKFNQHMRSAEQYLKQGKYYRAADTYTLASIYKPDDPLAYAGKSHALFAAGEYMSSALFLSRALEIFHEYALFKIDLVAMVGDKDKLESRIVDVKQWLQISGSPELHFLLAYVYYQMGRLSQAEKAINAACEEMPKSPAVIALKKAIGENRGL